MFIKRAIVTVMVFGLLTALTTFGVSALGNTNPESDETSKVAASEATSHELNVQDPETFDLFAAVESDTMVLMFPGLFQLEGYTYTEANSNSVAADDGRPVAQLQASAEVTAGPSAHIPENESQRFVDSGEIAFTDLAALRYTVDGYHLHVVTVQPSPAVGEHPLLLGPRTVTLADGTKAYAEEGVPSKNPYQLTFVSDGVIVALAGDMPIEMMVELASHVEVRR